MLSTWVIETVAGTKLNSVVATGPVTVPLLQFTLHHNSFTASLSSMENSLFKFEMKTVYIALLSVLCIGGKCK